MLYPDFNDLVALKERKFNLRHLSHRSVKSIVSGSHHSPFRGQGLEFDSVREYVPGDDIRNLDWRVTARTGAPHLKIFKEERERHIILCVDMNATMRFGTKQTFKSVQAARVAALLGWRGIDHHDRVSACLFGDVCGGIQIFAPKRTRKSLCAILKMLSTPPSEMHRIPLETIFKPIDQAAHTGSLIYFISDFMEINENFQNQAGISRLRKRCELTFIAINDPADKAIFPVGTLGFCASGTEKITVNTASMAGREAYATQWQKNRQQLEGIASSLKIPLLELTTESDVQRELMLGLKKIAKRKKR